MNDKRFAGILGTGHYAPKKILTNADLEKWWILRMNGSGQERVLKHAI